MLGPGFLYHSLESFLAHVQCELMKMVDCRERSSHEEQDNQFKNSPDFGHIQENQLWLPHGSKATDDCPISI